MLNKELGRLSNTVSSHSSKEGVLSRLCLQRSSSAVTVIGSQNSCINLCFLVAWLFCLVPMHHKGCASATKTLQLNHVSALYSHYKTALLNVKKYSR